MELQRWKVLAQVQVMDTRPAIVIILLDKVCAKCCDLQSFKTLYLNTVAIDSSE
jgi:hypothetical protein